MRILIIIVLFFAISCVNKEEKINTQIVDSTNVEEAIFDTSFFPLELLNKDYNNYENLYGESYFLKILKEDRLYSNDTINECFRLIWLRSLIYEPVVISLFKKNQKSILRLKKLIITNEDIDFSNFVFVDSVKNDNKYLYRYYIQKEIENNNFWNEFVQDINSFGFWDWRSFKESGFKSDKTYMIERCTDGSTFILEGINISDSNDNNKDYHFVKRHECDIRGTAFLECCKKLIYWTEEFKENQIY